MKKGENETKKDLLNDQVKDIKFIPDFSLTLREKCIYIKVTRQSYVKFIKLSNTCKNELTNNAGSNRIKKFASITDSAHIKADETQNFLDRKQASYSEKSNEQFLNDEDETTKSYLLKNKI